MPDAQSTKSKLLVPHNKYSRVILVHGIGHDRHQLAPLAKFLARHGFISHGVNLNPADATDGLELLAAQVRRGIDLLSVHNQKVHVIGFSMGGLVSRIAMQRLDGWQHMKSLITVASPHNGTIMALFRDVRGVVEMRPWSDLIVGMNADLEAGGPWGSVERPYLKQIWTPFDHLIVPPTSGKLSVGKNKMVVVAGHNQLIISQACFDEVLAGLLESEARQGDGSHDGSASG